MFAEPIAVFFYRMSTGRCPFKDWLESLEGRTRQAIDARLARVRRGLFGDDKSLGGGIWELRVDLGPGYRIYHGIRGSSVIVLLCGGAKGSQSRDIAKAREYWADHTREAG